jgi:hypothetical protein
MNMNQNILNETLSDFAAIHYQRQQTLEEEAGLLKRKRQDEREKERRESFQTTQNALSSFVEEEWSVIEGPIKEKEVPLLISRGVIHRASGPIDSFCEILEEFLDVLSEVINRNLNLKFVRCETKLNKKKTTYQEVLILFGTLMKLVDAKCPSRPSMYENFKDVAAETPMGFNRLKILVACMEPNDEEFDRLEEALRKLFFSSLLSS